MSVELHPIYGAFVPGASPFHIKGTAYRGFIADVDVNVPGGFENILANVEDPRAVAFLRQPFLSSSQYDILPLFDAGEVGARLADRPYRALVREGAAQQATRDIGGVYSALLRLASPRLVIERVPRIFMRYLDFGQMSGELTSPSRFDGTVSGIPKPACRWVQSAVEGFAPVVLGHAGARGVVVQFHRFEQDGVVSQMPLMTGNLTVRWDD